ncbi:MAG TPA: ferritin-like domain-containing protein, partial [Acidimicrobiales bacterium]|nr:ferritin-like domain-containing protein [Acidimicrobiales bacterium]
VTTKSAKDTLVAFFTETMRQHGDHKKAFQAQTVALDRNAKVQDAPNPKILALVDAADVGTVQKLVDFAALFEKVATDTYLLGLTMLADAATKALLAGAMAVEAQHVAGLRAVGALLKANAPQLVNVPFPATDLAKLPGAVGNVGFPDSLEKVNGADLIAEPTSGAVR